MQGLCRSQPCMHRSLHRGFCAELKAPPLSSQVLDPTAKWYCVDWWNRGIHPELKAPPLSSQAFYLTTVWYWADWCNALYWILSWAVGPISFLTRQNLSSNCCSLSLSLSLTHTHSFTQRHKYMYTHTHTKCAHKCEHAHIYTHTPTCTHTHTPGYGLELSVEPSITAYCFSQHSTTQVK